jgi:hypothetical protein
MEDQILEAVLLKLSNFVFIPLIKEVTIFVAAFLIEFHPDEAPDLIEVQILEILVFRLEK